MNKKSKALQAGVIFASFLVIAGAWKGFTHEYRFATAAQSNTSENARQILSDLNRNGLPLSARGLQAMMRNCAYLIFDNLEVKLSDSLRDEVDQTCQARAQDILERNRSHPDAHAIALASSPRFAAEDLRRAQASAAYEPWPLQIRLLALMRQPADHLQQSDIKAVLEQDIRRALAAHWSRQILATLYLQHDAIATVIRPVAEAAPNDQQRAFLGVVRRTMDSHRG